MPFYKAECREKHARTGAWKSGKNAYLTIAVIAADAVAADKRVQQGLFGSTFWQHEAIVEITRQQAAAIWTENGNTFTEADIDAELAEVGPAPTPTPKSITFEFAPGSTANARLILIGEQILAHHVSRHHTIYLRAPNMPDFNIGNWHQRLCGTEDLLLATSVKIDW